MTPLTEPTQKTRLEVMDSLLAPCRQQAGPLVDLHRQMLDKDPVFYGRLAVWNHTRGEARSESFVATLLTSPSTEHREAGFVLLQDLAPTQVSRIVKIMKRHVGRTPRSARAAVITYLRSLEADPVRFDRAVASARRSLKHLYAALHVRPSERADRVLFKGEAISLSEIDLQYGGAPEKAQPEPEHGHAVRRPTALLIDKSADMEPALEVGKRLAFLLSQHMEAELHVYTFDLVPYLVETEGTDHVAWEKAFRHVQAAGSMSVGNALEAIRRKRQAVEQLIIVTGTDENAGPRFVEAYKDYVAHVRAHPQVFVVQLGTGSEPLVDRLEAAGIATQAVEVETDTLYDLLPRLSRPSRNDLLAEILAVPLPTRRAA